MLGVIGAIRNKTAGPCSDRDADFLRKLMPHLARALKMHQLFAGLNAQAASLMECVDRFLRGLVLLDYRGRVVRANQSAERMAQAQDGLCLDSQGLRAVDKGESTELQRLILRPRKPRVVKALRRGNTDSFAPVAAPAIHCGGISSQGTFRGRVGRRNID